MQKYLYWLLIVYLAVGTVLPQIGVAAIICMLGPVIMAFWRGRFWCGHYCPRGSLNDNIVSRLSAKRPIPKLLKSGWWRALMICFIMTMFGIQLYFAWGSLAAVGLVFINIVAVTTAVAIVLGLIYKPRTWCSFCPMGTLASLAARKQKISGAVVNNASCVKCGVCQQSCPLELAPYRDNTAVMSDCLHCGICVSSCPKQAVEIKK